MRLLKNIINGWRIFYEANQLFKQLAKLGVISMNKTTQEGELMGYDVIGKVNSYGLHIVTYIELCQKTHMNSYLPPIINPKSLKWLNKPLTVITLA